MSISIIFISCAPLCLLSLGYPCFRHEIKTMAKACYIINYRGIKN